MQRIISYYEFWKANEDTKDGVRKFEEMNGIEKSKFPRIESVDMKNEMCMYTHNNKSYTSSIQELIYSIYGGIGWVSNPSVLMPWFEKHNPYKNK